MVFWKHFWINFWIQFFIGVSIGTQSQIALRLFGYKIQLSAIYCYLLHLFVFLIFHSTRRVIPYHKLLDYNWKEFFVGVLIVALTQIAVRLSGYNILLSPIQWQLVYVFILLIVTIIRILLDPNYAPFRSAIC